MTVDEALKVADDRRIDVPTSMACHVLAKEVERLQAIVAAKTKLKVPWGNAGEILKAAEEENRHERANTVVVD